MDFFGLWRKMGIDHATNRRGEAVAARGGGVFDGGGAGAGDADRSMVGNGRAGDFGRNMLKIPPLCDC